MLPVIGYTLRDENWLVVADEASVSGVEVVLEPGEPRPQVQNFLGEASFPYVSLRTERLTVGGRGSTPQGDFDLLTAMANANRATAISHQLTLPIDSVDAVCRHVGYLQRRLAPRPFFLGFTTGPDAPLGMIAPQDFGRIVSETGCGVTLDLTDIYISCVHSGFDPWAFVDEVLGAAPRIQLLLDGGAPTGDNWSLRRSSAEPVPGTVWNFYREVVEAAADRIDAVFLTRDLNFPDEDTWRGELRAARRWAELIVLSRAFAGARQVTAEPILL